MYRLIIAILCLLSMFSRAQETFPLNGVNDDKSELYYAFTNVTIFVDYQTLVRNSTLLIKDGLIEAVGNKVNIPKGAIVYDLKGKYIYPSFIDLYTDYGMPEVKKPSKRDFFLNESSKGAYNWNEAIKPEQSASKMFRKDSNEAEELRKLGFGVVLTHQKDGIARGTSSLVTLGEGKENELIITGDAAANFSFSKGASSINNPSSLMGAIALLRQTYLDADWYKANKKKNSEFNLSLEALNRNVALPQVFEVDNKLNALRADKLGDEFDMQYIIKGAGDEYQRLDDLAETNASFIIPVNFPYAYDVEDPYDAMMISLEELKHWELAPTNLSKLKNRNILFALTTSDLKKKSEFWNNLTKASKYGFNSADILKGLTAIPSQIINAQDKIGSLNVGLLANFIITSDSLLSDNFIIYENWIRGKQYIINDLKAIDPRGEYHLNLNSNKVYNLKISGEIDKPKAELILKDTLKSKVEVFIDKNLVTLLFDLNSNESKGFVRLTGKINFNGGVWDGRGQLPNGEWIAWSAIRNKKNGKVEQDTSYKLSDKVGDLLYPLTAYGWKDLPTQETVIIKNATIWTNETEGILLNHDIAINQGKIISIGQNLTKEYLFPKQKNEVKIIDAKGKHISPGIIDEHSHIAIWGGVNENTQAVTSEVRIGDVINSDDINIYRQLAGGVTSAQLLHGSSNPIGGQSALIKLKWGFSPEKLKINNTDGFIKFALGENVKQSNWGHQGSARFPQSRMGVEQVYFDAFYRAKEYDASWKKYHLLPLKEKTKAIPPRKNLELEALLEILNKKRFITCHSYVQSEINMLMHVADSMGFKVNTFTHILEGYKVIDKMKVHNAGASTFSDWWAYKFEVNDAIPFNAAMLQRAGVITAINSDDAEMGRRLNQEAAKAIKYGGASEQDALKMITLNPAKLLHLDSLVGSLKVGKDADIVVWSGNPLSVYSKVEKTFIDGICFFDIEKDKRIRLEISQEKARIIQKMLFAKKNGETTKKPESKKQKLYHCDTLEEH